MKFTEIELRLLVIALDVLIEDNDSQETDLEVIQARELISKIKKEISHETNRFSNSA